MPLARGVYFALYSPGAKGLADPAVLAFPHPVCAVVFAVVVVLCLIVVLLFALTEVIGLLILGTFPAFFYFRFSCCCVMNTWPPKPQIQGSSHRE